MDYFTTNFINEQGIFDKNIFFNELMIFYLIYCHINKKNINYEDIYLFIVNSLKSTFDSESNIASKELLKKIMDIIFNCNDFDIEELDNYMEEHTITYDLRKMFKTLKTRSYNFSEHRIRLASLREDNFYSFNFKDDIDSIIKDFETLISSFSSKREKCKEAKNLLKKSYRGYNSLLEFRNNSVINIRQFVIFRSNFSETLSLFIDCYKELKTEYTLFSGNKSFNAITRILTNYFELINIKLNFFLFFLQEIYKICKLLGIDIIYIKRYFDFTDILKENFNEIYNQIFLKLIFKSDLDNISFISLLFNKDARNIDELIRLLILKTIVKYFRDITDIENFIKGIKNIERIPQDLKSFLDNIKDALINIYDRIISSDTYNSLLYKGFLYLLMLYLLFINETGIIIRTDTTSSSHYLVLTKRDLYILKSNKTKKNDISYKLKMEDSQVIEFYKVFFNISNIFKLVITKSDYSDIISYTDEDITEEEFEERLQQQTKKESEEIIRILYRYKPTGITFYLKNNVRSKIDIINFLKLIKKYLPNMFDSLCLLANFKDSIEEIMTGTEDTEIVPDENGRSPIQLRSIVFSPYKSSPTPPNKPAKPQGILSSLFNKSRVTPLNQQDIYIVPPQSQRIRSVP